MNAIELSELLSEIRGQRVLVEMTNTAGEVLRGEIKEVVQKGTDDTVLIFEPWNDFAMLNKKQGE